MPCEAREDATVLDRAQACKKSRGSTPAPQTVANGRAPSDRPRTVPASLASRTPRVRCSVPRSTSRGRSCYRWRADGAARRLGELLSDGALQLDGTDAAPAACATSQSAPAPLPSDWLTHWPPAD